MTAIPNPSLRPRLSARMRKPVEREAAKQMDRAFEETITRERKRQGRVRLIIELCVTAFVVFQVFGLLLGISRVEGSSMAPSLQKNDWAIYYRLDRTYLRGDIVLFRQDDRLYVKRVIAIAGDVVDLNEDAGILTVNGKEEHYGIETTLAHENGTEFPLTIQENRVFLLGDNRVVSKDSREGSIGAIQTNDIQGRLICLFRIEQRSKG